VKNSLGWAHYQVRKDIAIKRHWQMVCCAFAFWWWESLGFVEEETSPGVVLHENSPTLAAKTQAAERGKKERRSTQTTTSVMAIRTAQSESVAGNHT
jgi:hypothetical protein